MAEWDVAKNNDAGNDPHTLSIGSHKSAYWICSIHKTGYRQVVRDKYRGQRGCPYCLHDYRGKINRERLIEGKAVLAETHPTLAAEWVGCKNPQITPYTCVAGSNIMVKWKCSKCNGEYESYLSNRALKGVWYITELNVQSAKEEKGRSMCTMPKHMLSCVHLRTQKLCANTLV